MTFMISIPAAVTPGEFLAYAYRETNAANNFLLKLGSLAGNLTPPTINPEFPSSPAAPPLTLPEPPEGATIVWTAPGSRGLLRQHHGRRHPARAVRG
jgi:hypothetical protein